MAALELLKEIADKYDGVSYADLFQMASAVAVEVGMGCTIDRCSADMLTEWHA